MGTQDLKAARVDKKRTPTGISAWVAFDFLNSILIINGTVHFSTWLQGTGVDERWYGLVFSISSLVLLIGLPILGVFIDRHRVGGGVAFASCVAMAACAFAVTAIGHWGAGGSRTLAALITFGLMNVAYQASLVGYNWLLVYVRGVRSERDVRRVSGLGEAGGAAGSVAGLLLGIGLLQILERSGAKDPRIDMFLVLGVIFLVAIAADLRVLRRGVDLSRAPHVRTRYDRLWSEWSRVLRTETNLRRFFLSFFFFANAILTVQLFLPIHMQSDLGYGASETALAAALALGGSAAGGFLYARLGARHDTRQVIVGLLALVVPGLVVLGRAREAPAFLGALVFVGGASGALWGASRAHLILLTERAKLGQSLAFFAVFERSASVLGPIVWGAVVSLPGRGPGRFALASMAMSAMVLLGLAIMWVGRDARVTRRLRTGG